MSERSTYPRDPVFHAGITDELPSDHPLAFSSVYCVNCRMMVHAVNNETMASWFETGRGAWCFDCFVAAVEADGIEDEWGLQ